MSLPAGVLTRPVKLAPQVNHSGDLLTIRATIEPSHTVVHAVSGTALANIATDNTADAGTGIVLDLPVTDQDGFTDTSGNSFTGWAYTARIELVDNAGRAKYLTKKFQVPTALTELDLMQVPGGNPAAPIVAATPLVLSVAGLAGVVTAEAIAEQQGAYLSWAADPSKLWTGDVTYTNGAPMSAAILWPDGVTGTYTGTPSATFTGAIDSYTLTHGTTTYTQPAITRDTAGNITNRPAITQETA